MNWKPWLYSLASSAIGGGATSLSTWLGMTVAKNLGVDVPVLNWHSLCVVALSGAIVSTAAYLKQSPLPPTQ